MSVRRSPRLAKVPTDMISPGCMLSNATVAGCCYRQDLRPKVKSHSGRMRDPVENLPIVVRDQEYVDGRGTITRRKICYANYCPACQEYWHQRVKGFKDKVAFYCETLVNVCGLPMHDTRVRYEPIQPGESMADAIRRIYTAYPNARLLADSAKSDASEWNRV